MTNIVLGVASVIIAFAWIGQTEMNLVDVLHPNTFLFSVYYNLPSWMSSGLNFALLFFAGLNSMVKISAKLITNLTNVLLHNNLLFFYPQVPLFYAIVNNLAENLPVTKKSYLWWIICCFLCCFVGLVNVFGLSKV